MVKQLEDGTASIDINNKLVEKILSQSNSNELFGKDGLFQ